MFIYNLSPFDYLCAFFLYANVSLQASQVRPNIIVILTDDMGYSDLGCYGSEIETPHLDKLANDGVKFSQFYNTSRCSPTRAALLTGLYSHQAGMGLLTKDEGEHNPGFRGRLTERCVTLAEVLSSSGYLNIHTGKWHLGDAKKEWWPLGRGFDRCFSIPQGGGFYFKPSTWPDRCIIRGNEVIYDKNNDPPKSFYATDAFTNEGLIYVEEAVKNNQPFFWYLAYNAPHFPLQAKPKDIEKYRGKYMMGWDELRKERHQRLIDLGLIDSNWKLPRRHDSVVAWDELPYNKKVMHDERMAIYAAMIDCIDQNVGKVVEHLKKLNIFDNTLILFLHDNGAMAGPNEFHMGLNKKKGTPGSARSEVYYGTCWADASDVPFRKHKGFVHEGGIASPLIVSWPNGIKPAISGKIIRETTHLIDIMPTCVQISNTPYPDNYKGNKIMPMEGHSLLPLLQGETLNRKVPIFFEHKGNKAVRQNKWKLVADKGRQWELYDMEADRTELNNLALKIPEKVKELSQLYENWAKRCFVKKKRRK